LRLLVDRCARRKLADCLREQGHDFGTLIHLRSQPHAGLVRLPDVPPAVRIQLMGQILARYPEEELSRAIVTVKGSRIRIARRIPVAGSNGSRKS
jgi:predicted nuclease of predicted toxin-antitoxin system